MRNHKFLTALLICIAFLQSAHITYADDIREVRNRVQAITANDASLPTGVSSAKGLMAEIF